MKNKNALIIIAKHPDKGSVKTRLAGMMTDEDRLKLYTFLLKSTFSRLGSIIGVDTFIAFAPIHAERYFSSFGLHLLPLPEGDLGVRMFHAFREIISHGYRKASLVGVDIPDLSSHIILKAFKMLNKCDVVFGPAQDGGYYLIGMKQPIHELFHGIPWSSGITLQRSMEKARDLRYTVSLTEQLSDIDTIEDVKKAGFLM
jgi:rSAM/selenodomain-associated transferase 1